MKAISFIFIFFSTVIVLSAGCRPRVETAVDAHPWPSAETDPREMEQASDAWPGWRGIGGLGIAKGHPPIEFGPEGNLRWQVGVPGEGNSSPIAWKDRVFLTTALDKTDPPTLALLAFDRADGNELWRTELGTAVGDTHAKNGYASATPVTDGEAIYVFLGTTGLFRVGMDGNRKWKADLGRLDHIWGTAASPILYKDTVIQSCDSAEQSYIAAFDKTTGKRRWRTQRQSTGGWSTPIVVTAETPDGPRSELIVHGAAGDEESGRFLAAYDPDSGSLLWRLPGTTEFAVPTPVHGGGLVFCASGRNGPVFAVRPGGEGILDENHILWRRHRGGPYIPSPLLYRNRLYTIGDGGIVHCYNPGDGREIWRNRLRGQFTASPVATDGRIYAVSEQGTVYVFAAADSFELLAKNELGERSLATPAISGNDLFVRTKRTLFRFGTEDSTEPDIAIRKDGDTPLNGGESERSAATQPTSTDSDVAAASADGWPVFRGSASATGLAGTTLPEEPRRRWSFRADEGGFESTAAIADGTVYIGCTDGNLYAFGLSDGEKRWAFTTELGFTAPIAATDGRVYAADADGKVYCLQANDGSLAWEFQAEAEINSGPNFFTRSSGETVVLFGDQSGLLFAVHAVSGELVWKYQSPDQIRCSPAIADGVTFIAGCDGRLHVVDCETGEETASVELGDPTGSTPAVAGSSAYVGTEGNRFFAVDWKSGSVTWTFENRRRPAAFRSSAALTDQLVLVGSRDKVVYAIGRATGEERWSFPTRGRVDGSPVVVGERVYVGSSDGFLYGLDIKSGVKEWEFETGGAILASPAVAAGSLVIGTDDGDLYCFGE